MRKVIRTNHFNYSTERLMSIEYTGLIFSIIKDIQMKLVQVR